MASHLHEFFLRKWEDHASPEWENNQPYCEVKFTFVKDWRLDCAWPSRLVAVEIDGGTWTSGRHSRGAGYAEDCRKLNTATEMGWAVLRYTTDMLEADPIGIVRQVESLLRSRPVVANTARHIAIVRHIKAGQEVSTGAQSVKRINARSYEATVGGQVLTFTQRKGVALIDLQKRVIDALDRKAA
jgi:very-short-patch-repair endonuclease